MQSDWTCSCSLAELGTWKLNTLFFCLQNIYLHEKCVLVWNTYYHGAWKVNMNFLECAVHKGWWNITSYFWWYKNVAEDKVGLCSGEPKTKKESGWPWKDYRGWLALTRLQITFSNWGERQLCVDELVEKELSISSKSLKPGHPP